MIHVRWWWVVGPNLMCLPPQMVCGEAEPRAPLPQAGCEVGGMVRAHSAPARLRPPLGDDAPTAAEVAAAAANGASLSKRGRRGLWPEGSEIGRCVAGAMAAEATKARSATGVVRAGSAGGYASRAAVVGGQAPGGGRRRGGVGGEGVGGVAGGGKARGSVGGRGDGGVADSPHSSRSV